MSHLSRALLLLCLCTATAVHAADCGAPPATMSAARIDAAGGPERLRIETVPVPRIGAGDVLVRVHYASVNPVDWKLQESGGLPYPATPGGDFSGEIVAIGADVRGRACGDRVAGIVDQAARSGSYAEYVAVAASEIVPVPARFDMQQAAAHPTVAVAAWRFLLQGTGVEAGERVLVHGGAGGVGSMLVQMAKARGAFVIATASARNHDYLRALGADEVIDYRAVRFEDVVREVDVVVDTVGGDTLQRSPQVLRDGGRLVSMAGRIPAEVCEAGRVVCSPQGPWDVARGLAAAAGFIDAGTLTVHVDRVYPLAEVAAAQRHNRDGGSRGKVVIAMPVAAP